MSNTRLFFYLTAGFIVATIAGTQLHEFGHYAAASLFGYDATISYSSVSLAESAWNIVTPTEHRWIIAAGPLQTILTGLIGLILVLIYRRSFLSATRLSFRQWVMIFLTFFWSREIFNLVMWTGHNIMKGEVSYRMDEVRLAMYCNLPYWLIIAIAGSIGALVLLTVFFKFIPRRQRLTFIAAGITGSTAGFILWFYLLGPILLP
jgi:hypothetical protein